MKKLLVETILLALAIAAPLSAQAQISVNIGVPLPPPIVIQGPPNVVVLPDAPDVYVDPDVAVDLFFWNGWWWQLWDGRWYRSHYYNRGWVYYNRVPTFYFDVDPNWRGYYRSHNWAGHPWNYQRIPNAQLQSNWRSWHANGYWQKQKAWGVQSYQPRPQREQQVVRQQRQQEYQRRPEVQREQERQKGRPEGRPERGEEEHR